VVSPNEAAAAAKAVLNAAAVIGVEPVANDFVFDIML